MGFRFHRNLNVGSRFDATGPGISQTMGRDDVRFTFRPHETRTTVGIGGSGVGLTERTPIRQGRSRTGGLLDAIIYVGLLLAAIALFA